MLSFRKVCLISSFASMVIMLTGCTIRTSDLKAKDAEVSEWNNLTVSTLGIYKVAKSFAEQNKIGLLNLVLKDETWAMFSSLSPLTEEDLKAFKITSLVHDEYFTALGADSVREVLVINGHYRRMFVTVIWGKDSVRSLDRVVVDI